jgi:hypothetical protein
LSKVFSGIIDGSIIPRTFFAKDSPGSTFLGDAVKVLEAFGSRRIRGDGATAVNGRVSTWAVRAMLSWTRALLGRQGTSEVNCISGELLGESLKVMEIHFFLKLELVALAEILKRRGGLGSGKGSCGKILDNRALVWRCHSLVGRASRW